MFKTMTAELKIAEAVRVARKPFHLSILPYSRERKNGRKMMVDLMSSVLLPEKQLSPCHLFFFLTYCRGRGTQSIPKF